MIDNQMTKILQANENFTMAYVYGKKLEIIEKANAAIKEYTAMINQLSAITTTKIEVSGS